MAFGVAPTDVIRLILAVKDIINQAVSNQKDLKDLVTRVNADITDLTQFLSRRKPKDEHVYQWRDLLDGLKSDLKEFSERGQGLIVTAPLYSLDGVRQRARSLAQSKSIRKDIDCLRRKIQEHYQRFMVLSNVAILSAQDRLLSRQDELQGGQHILLNGQDELIGGQHELRRGQDNIQYMVQAIYLGWCSNKISNGSNDGQSDSPGTMQPTERHQTGSPKRPQRRGSSFMDKTKLHLLQLGQHKSRSFSILRFLVHLRDMSTSHRGIPHSFWTFAHDMEELCRSLRSRDISYARGVSEHLIKVYRRLTAEGPTYYQIRLASSLNSHARLLSRTHEPPEEVLKSAREAVQIYESLRASNPEKINKSLATALHNVSTVYLSNNSPARALPYSQRAVEILRPLAKKCEERSLLLVYLTDCYAALSELKRFKEGAVVLEEMVGIQEGLSQNDSRVELSLAETRRKLAGIYMDLGEHRLARSSMESAVRIIRSHASVAHPPISTQDTLSVYLNAFREMMIKVSDEKEVLKVTAELVDLRRKLVRRDPHYKTFLGAALYHYADQLRGQERYGEAKKMVDEALEVQGSISTPKDPTAAQQNKTCIAASTRLKRKIEQHLSSARKGG